MQQGTKDRITEVLRFAKSKIVQLELKDWLFVGILFLYVDEFRNLIMAAIAATVLLNLLLLDYARKDKKDNDNADG